MTGYRNTKEIYADQTRENADTSFKIDQVKIYDTGTYNCTIRKILPPPIKNFPTPLIQLFVQGKVIQFKYTNFVNSETLSCFRTVSHS